MSEFDDTSDLTDDECRQILRVVANERDALRERTEKAEAEAERLRGVIERAPHGIACDIFACNCWKAAIAAARSVKP